MKKLNVLTLVMLCISMLAIGQNEEFKPSGKPFMRIYTDYHSEFSDGEMNHGFALERVYLGYEYAFSKTLSGKANIDVGDPGVGKYQMVAFVKNAYLKYKKNEWTINFGMISTNQFKLQEDAWGYRYFAKSFQDEYSFNSSADLGVSVAYKFCDAFSADVIIANGEGYKKVQADSTLRTGFGVTAKPVSNLTARAYYDFSTKETTQSSVATFLGYADDNVSVSAEFMKQFNTSFKENNDMTGLSFYATVKASKNIKFFGRFDDLSSSNDWNLSKDGQMIYLGFEYNPVKGIKFAPNFRSWNPADDNKAATTSLFLNCEIRF